MNLKQLVIRSISGLVYVAIVVVALLFKAPYGAMALALLFGLLASIEFDKLTAPDDEPRSLLVRIIDTLICLLIIAAPALLFSKHLSQSLILVLLGMLPLLAFIRFVIPIFSNARHPLRELAYSTFLYLYLGVSLACMGLLACADHNATQGSSNWFVLAMFILIWLNDTGAYLVGCTIGRHKMCERVSPKKTWEGFFGGMAFCIGGSFLMLLMPVYEYAEPWALVIIGIVVSVMATLGDLFESIIKRTMGRKDSGKIMPGHGGILDRIDSLLFVMPAALFLLLILS